MISRSEIILPASNCTLLTLPVLWAFLILMCAFTEHEHYSDGASRPRGILPKDPSGRQVLLASIADLM